MTMTFSDYDVKTLEFEEKTYGKLMTFRNTAGKTFIQYPWIKCGKFVVPDDKFCKEVKDTACIRMPTPSNGEFAEYLEKLDEHLNIKEFKSKNGLKNTHELKNKFKESEMMKLKMPIDEHGIVLCKMFAVIWKGKTAIRKSLTEIHIDKLSKYLSNSIIRVIVVPTKMWNNSTGYGVQFEVARLEFEQPPKHDDEVLEVFDDEEPIPIQVHDDDDEDEPDDEV